MLARLPNAVKVSRSANFEIYVARRGQFLHNTGLPHIVIRTYDRRWEAASIGYNGQPMRDLLAVVRPKPITVIGSNLTVCFPREPHRDRAAFLSHARAVQMHKVSKADVVLGICEKGDWGFFGHGHYEIVRAPSARQ